VSDRTLRLGVVAVALVGIAIAGYLTLVHYRPDSLICTGSGGCETVQESSYAELFGIPVALLGLGAYVVVLALVAWDAELARTLAAAVALGGLAFAGYLVALQAFVIEAWCVWCLVNDVAVLPLLAVLTVWRALASPR
jgi:uncharacterized membrane protein